MEAKPRSMFNSALIYGLITGATYIVLSLIMYIADLPPKSPVGYIAFVILIGGIYWGSLQYRNKSLNGYISYGQAFLNGFLIVVIGTVLASIYSYLFFAFFDPAAHAKIVETALDQTRQKLMDKGMSDDQIESAVNMSKGFMSPIAMSLFQLLMNTIFGGIVALITAAIIKKEDTSFEGQFKDVQ